MIPDRFKNIRKSLGYTQNDFAKLLGTTQQCISDYEKAKNQIPDKIKEKLYNLGYNINWLISGKGQMFHNENDSQIVSTDKLQRLEHLKILLSEGIVDSKDVTYLKKEIIYGSNQ
jgi:transcriptional regulator with XRE-family HTH domain